MILPGLSRAGREKKNRDSRFREGYKNDLLKLVRQLFQFPFLHQTTTYAFVRFVNQVVIIKIPAEKRIIFHTKWLDSFQKYTFFKTIPIVVAFPAFVVPFCLDN